MSDYNPNLPGAYNRYPKTAKPTRDELLQRDGAGGGARNDIGRKDDKKIDSMSATDVDPYGNYYFALEINNTEVAHFLECSGLKNGSTAFEIIEGGLNGNVHKRPGQSKWENIILKYATSASTFLLEWRDAFLQDQFDKRTQYSGSIAVMSNDGTVVRRFHFTNAWPVSWEGPHLSSNQSELAIETLEIAHSGLTLLSAGTAWSKLNVNAAK